MRPLRNLALIGTALLLLVLGGTAGYHFVEGWEWLESLYMVVITLTTAGYREVHPLSERGMWLTMALLVTGVGLLFLGIGVLTQLLIEFELGKFFGRRRMEREIAQLSGHYILCGAGRVGRSAARELARERVPFVIVEQDAGKLARLPQEWLQLQGDASQEAALRQAQIEHAAGLVAATTTDATNLFIVMTARSLNSRLKIIARASEEAGEKHLLTAGADSVISPYAFAGRRIAQSFLRPHVLSFLDIALAHDGRPELEIEEIFVGEGSPLTGKSIAGSQIRQETGAIVLAIKREGAAMQFNPPPEEQIRAGDHLIAIGEPAGLKRLEESAAGAAARP